MGIAYGTPEWVLLMKPQSGYCDGNPGISAVGTPEWVLRWEPRSGYCDGNPGVGTAMGTPEWVLLMEPRSGYLDGNSGVGTVMGTPASVLLMHGTSKNTYTCARANPHHHTHIQHFWQTEKPLCWSPTPLPSSLPQSLSPPPPPRSSAFPPALL